MPSLDKNAARQRRARRTREKIRRLNVPRLCIFRTPKHIYAQIIAPDGGHVLAAASTVSKGLRGEIKTTGNVEAARAVGKAVGELGLKAGVDKVAFDRAGYPYHGRVKALAEAAREAGLKF